MAYEYLHTSMYGSYYVKCKVLYRIPFDVEKHSVGLERVLFLARGIIPEKQGQLGYIIKYEDPHHPDTRYFCVSMEALNDYTPISLEQIKQNYDK